MKMSNDLLQKLMNEVDHGIDGLLVKLARQQEEINQLKNENKQLKSNYAQILEQIATYIAELEKIKHSNT